MTWDFLTCIHDSTNYKMGNSKKYPYTTTDDFLEFQGQGGFFELVFLKAWWSTYIWDSEGLKMLILWTLPVCKWSTTERRDTDDHRESAGYRRSIDWSGTCWRKPIKLGLYIKLLNFLMMNIKLIEYEQILVRICMVNIDAPVGIGWTAKTCTSPLLL